MDLDGKVVIITGASTGIGANTAQYLAQFRAKLSLVARSADKLKNVEQRCVEKGAKVDDVLTITASIREEADIKKIIQATVDKFGRIDHLGGRGNRRSESSIVNISSVNSEIMEYKIAAYCITKAGLEHFTRLLALKVAPDKVRVNAIAPGFVVTDTLLHSFPDDKKDEMEQMMKKVAISQQPLGGGMDMESVAKAIHFLLTDGACAITGECIRVDNGYHISMNRGIGGSGHMDNTGLTDLPTQEKQAMKKPAI